MKKLRVIKDKSGLPLPDITLADASAIKALARGDATPAQQGIALDWFIKKAGMIGTMEFDPISDRMSAFNGGRRFVSTTAVYILTTDIKTFDTNPTNQPKENL